MACLLLNVLVRTVTAGHAVLCGQYATFDVKAENMCTSAL
jgi:hypothetical protein